MKPETTSSVVIHDWSTKPNEELSEDLEWEDPDFLNGKCNFKFKFEEDSIVSQKQSSNHDETLFRAFPVTYYESHIAGRCQNVKMVFDISLPSESFKRLLENKHALNELW